jgi:hypothetical protein
MSRVPSGVASIAKYCRVHLIDPITGHDASPDATVIAVAASRPGATKSMYGTPRDAPEDLFTSVPSPTPRAPR